MKRILLWALPLLIFLGFILEQFGVLHVSFLHIKTHELKWTELDYSYHPREGDIFTTGETVTNFFYEDALIAINPSYTTLLEKDLREISKQRDYIDYIDGQHKAIYTPEYIVQLCLEQNNLVVKDSTSFRKIADLEILGHFELYDRISGDLLHKEDHEKWWIRDKLMFYGISRSQFLQNKIEEIWMAQASNQIKTLIIDYEYGQSMDQLEANAIDARELIQDQKDLNTLLNEPSREDHVQAQFVEEE